MAIQKRADCGDSNKSTNKSTEKTPTPQKKLVEEAAYYIAEKRGFEPGHEIDDWIAAERHVTAILKRSSK